MKVILKQDIPGLGRKYDIIALASGYANNFLIPKGMAVAATGPNLLMREEDVRQAGQKAARLRQQQVDVARQLEKKKFVLKVKTGEQGKFYGSITPLQVVGLLQESHPELKLSHQDVSFPEPIKALGEHKAVLALTEGVKATIHLQLVGN